MNIQELSDNLGLDKEDYLELLELMVSSGGEDLDRLQSALETGDAETAAKAAHSLKGATANLGLTDLSEVAKEVELSAKSGTLQGLTEKVEILGQKLQELATLVS